MSADTTNRGGYDVIGDIHGYAEPLDVLLDELGYRVVNGSWQAPKDRQLVFVGDLIDRGPNQLRVLETVKSLVDAGVAQITLGNHEFNALCWSIENPAKNGTYLRPHNPKNWKQHHKFLGQLTDKQCSEFIEWFLTLPLWLDLGGLRVIHACWDEKSRRRLEKQLGGASFGTRQAVIDVVSNKKTRTAVDTLLKGPELSLTRHDLPRFLDKDGHPRGEARLKWWVRGTDRVVDLAEIPPRSKTEKKKPYPKIKRHLIADEAHQFDFHGGSPVIYGHYWRQRADGVEIACTADTACVDFSAGRGGPLAAYQWNAGDTVISGENYVFHR